MSRPPRLIAADIAHALGGRRSGHGYIARCPGHDDRSPSLSIADAADGADSKVLVHCHAGCAQETVIAALRARGLWSAPTFQPPTRHVRHPLITPSAIDQNAERRSGYAISLWEQGVPIEGTVAETYLRSRGITVSLPSSLRFHDRLKHTPTGSYWPAMIALITRSVTAEPIGIHRTYIDDNGAGKAPIEPQKMMLGAASGGVVRLAETTDTVMVAEGIETALSVQQACAVPTWAALSANGLKAINLPPGITTITILADGDSVGESAALAAGRRLKNAVRSVRVVRAPTGTDFNDILHIPTKRESQS